MPTTTSSGAKVPAGADPNNIPSAFVEYDASKDPRLTTAQIAAMPWSAKPAGWTAYDTTQNRLVISTGAAMVAVLDARGGVLADDLRIAGVDPQLIIDSLGQGDAALWFARAGVLRWAFLHDMATTAFDLVRFNSSGAFVDRPVSVDDETGAVTLAGDLIFDNGNGWRILASTGGVFAIQRRDPATGAYLDNPLLITAAGHVESRSHIGSVVVGATSMTTVNLPTSPTGRWSVVASSTASTPDVQVQMITATQVRFTLPTLVTADIHYHAIAY